jgi:two-component system KDP operon response regulator KdpE
MSKQRSRVLVVDDEEGILRAVGRALVINGYDVETAADGTTAIHSLTAQAPDVRSNFLTTSRTKHA